MTELDPKLAEQRDKVRRFKPDFDFTRMAEVPFLRGGPPAREARLALVTSAGVHLPDQPPFDRYSPAGDCNWREIPAAVDRSQIRIWWDEEGKQSANQDLNCVLPVPLAAELVASGELGGLAPHHYSFSGAIPDPAPLLKESGPALARRLLEQGITAVLLAPA